MALFAGHLYKQSTVKYYEIDNRFHYHSVLLHASEFSVLAVDVKRWYECAADFTLCIMKSGAAEAC